MDRPEEHEENYLTKLENYCDWVEKLAADRSMECNSLQIKLESKVKNLGLFDVRLSLPSNEVINIEAREIRMYPKSSKHLVNMQNAFIDGANWAIKESIEGNEA